MSHTSKHLKYVIENYHNGKTEVEAVLKACKATNKMFVNKETKYSSWKGRQEVSISLWFGGSSRVGDSDQVGIYFVPVSELIADCEEALGGV